MAIFHLFSKVATISKIKILIHKGSVITIKLQQLSYNRMNYCKVDNSGKADCNPKLKKPRAMELTIGTHSGTFHCDEVLACFMLKQLPEYENASVFRSRDNKELSEKCDIIVDVGGVFDHKRKLYDHHQNSFQETLSSLKPEYGSNNNIRLSSAGLIYTYYGEQVISYILKKQRNVILSPENLKMAFISIYEKFIREIDGIDNGVPMFDGEPSYKICTGICARIKNFNPSWDEPNVDLDEQFEKAVQAIGTEFTAAVISIGTSWINAREHVKHAVENAKSIYKTGEILQLETFCPWKSHLSDLEKQCGIEGIPKYVIYEENSTSWRVAGVPLSPSSYLGRKFFPNSWRGLCDDKLSEVAGVPCLVFCHHTGFIGGATTREAALQMAINSLNSKEE